MRCFFGVIGAIGVSDKPMIGYSLRAMSQDDLPQVLAIERQAFTEPWSKQAFLGELGQACSRAWVALTENDQVAGFIIIWITEETCQIVTMAVLPEFRHQGLGRAMLSHALEHSQRQGACEWWLEVRASNVAAQSLYHYLGFVPTGRRQGYYTGPREDAILMTRRRHNAIEERS